MDVSVIIINYNSSKYSIACIESIFKFTTDVQFEIIVVDNASKTEDLNDIEAFTNSKDIRLIKSKTNLGFGGGNHLGYQFAKGHYLAFVNNDTELTENSLLKLQTYMKAHNDIGVLGLNQVDEDGKAFKYSYRQNIGLRYQLLGNASPQKYYAKKYDEDHLDKPFEVDMVSGAFMFFNTKAYEVAGGFDANIFLFYEEMDVCKRLKQKGYKTVFYPESTFIHYQGKSSGSVIMKNEFTVSYLYMIQKNYSYAYYMAVKLVLLLKYGFKSIIKPKRYFSPFLMVLKGGNSLVYSMKLKH